MTDRYRVSGDQGRYEPGSNDQVLANKLGIVDPQEMDDAELYLLSQLYTALLRDDLPDRTLTVADLKHWHRRWLGNVYDWAGEERSVNMAKGEFHFAAAAQIPRLPAEFERDRLARFTPGFSPVSRGQWSTGALAGGRDDHAGTTKPAGLSAMG